MKAVSKQIVLALAAAPLLLTALGCSALGFSAVPVAHLMTSDTREVLEQTSKLPAVPRELAKEPLAAYYLQPGDELLIDVMTSSDVQIPTDQRVLSDGSIDLGSVGRIVVSGMTLEQTEAELRRALLTNVDDIDQDELTVNAQLIQPIQRFYVVGEVNAPGAYPLVGFETVLDGIMEAGGLTARASACDILLARPTSPCSCRVTLPVCYRAITQLGDTTTNYHLRPGDRIFVARQSFSEELMAYVSGAEPCPRCCRDPAACCDPRTAEPNSPEFLPAAIVQIPAAQWMTPARASVNDTGLIEGFNGSEPRLEQVEVPAGPSENGNQIPAEEALDGELNFGDLLRN